MAVSDVEEQLQHEVQSAIAQAALLELKCRAVKRANIEELTDEALETLAKEAF